MKSFLVSIAIPVFNEEKNIFPLLEQLISLINGFNYEVIFVDDGSTDRSAELIQQAAKNNERIKLISFYRNFGHQNALSCGYKHAKGDCVISMDADLQDPPTLIPKMIEKWESGAKIVYAKRKKRDQDTFFKKQTAQLFYRIINILSETPIPYDVGDFRLVDREVVTFLNNLPEHSPFLRGLVAWGGFPTDYVEYERQKRHSGKTHYSILKMINFATEGIISFSPKPLRIASYFGFFSASVGFMGIVYAIMGKVFFPEYWITGWTALFVGIMFLGGVQLITIGIIGEYLNKVYQEVHNRPHYLIKETINITLEKNLRSVSR